MLDYISLFSENQTPKQGTNKITGFNASKRGKIRRKTLAKKRTDTREKTMKNTSSQRDFQRAQIHPYKRDGVSTKRGPKTEDPKTKN